MYKMCTVTRPNLLADCQLSVVRPRKIGTNHPLQWVVVDIVLPSILNTTDISAESIDPKAPDDNYFIFSKNGVKESDERLTETVIAKDSPLKKDDPTGTKRIERIEFAKRTYRFKLWNYSTTRTENIARVTVSYQPDPQKTKKEEAYQEIKNLMNN